MRSASTSCRIRFSTSATCFSVRSSPSVMISSTSGCCLASAMMSLLNWARHGSIVVACEKPIFHFLSCAEPSTLPSATTSDAPTTAARANLAKSPRVMCTSSQLPREALGRRSVMGCRFLRRRSWRAETQIAQQFAEIALLHKHGADDDQALQDELKVRVDVMKLQDVRQKAENEHAAEGAGEAAATSHEARAANDDSRNGIELQACPRIRLALAVLGHEQDGGDPCEHAGNGVGDDLDAPDIDAREARRLLIAADSVDVSAEWRKPQHGAIDERGGDEEQARHRKNAEDQ